MLQEKPRYADYQATLTALKKFSKPGMRFDLAPMRELSKRLGDPWKNFPSVLIAGTNGKGSTAAILSEILSQSGRKVGLYTSPHLSSYLERLIIRDTSHLNFANTDAASASRHLRTAWCRAFSKLAEALQTDQREFTEFELLTALAFLVFADAKVDIAILEAGLGGRLDATNVVDPILSVITSINYDHKEILGETLSEIAYEKSGIFRSDKPALTLEQPSEVMQTLEREARLKKCNLSFVSSGKLLEMSLNEQTFEYDQKTYRQSMIGIHQVENAVLAIESARTLRKLGYSISDKHIESGVKSARWPGRMEILSEKPLVLCDGAHNPQGCKMLIRNLKALPLKNPAILVIGMLDDKDVDGMIEALSPWGDRWIITESKNSRAIRTERLLETVKAVLPKKSAVAAKTVADAYREALKENGQTICFAGSLTIAAEARRLFKKR